MTWPHFLDTILCNGFVLAAEPLGNGSYVCAEHSQRRCGGDRRKILYRVPEIVTRGRFPDGGESDSTWRIQEARHVGSDTIAPGF